MKFISLLFVSILLVQGCTSIDQPTASRSLVEYEFVSPTSSVDPTLANALSTVEQGTVVQIQQQPTVFGDKFFAATGLICRKLITEVSGQNTYCQHPSGSWFRVKKVISEYNESVTAGASL